MNLSQNSDFSIISANEAASIVCRFTPEMIEDLVEDALNNKYRNYSMSMTNIVEVIEQNYKVSLSGIPEFSSEINSQRCDIYSQVIDMVCKAHNLTYIGNENDDIYSAATWIYDFLVARFNIYITNFFVNYINREKNMIYETLELASKKKDASSYSKKLYKNGNSKLAIIHANLEFVLQNICAYDVPFDTYIDLAYIPNRQVAKYLQSILLDNGDFFKRQIVNYFNQHYAELTTQVKFALQGLASVEFTDLV